MDAAERSEKPVSRKQLCCRVLTILACAASAAMLAAVAFRPVTSVDLGYHLAYGQQFIQTGRIVQDDSFIHPRVTPEAPGGELPPGAYFDSEGRYRFPNANWLTQVILAWLWDRGGFTMMNVTLMAMIVAIAAGQAAILRRLGVPLAWLAGVWLAAGFAGYERFMVRPELFAFVCLIWQIWLLCGPITWGRVIAFVAVQILAANLHSYWLLGAGVAFAFAADVAMRAAWNRWAAANTNPDPQLRRRLLRLAVCAAAMVPAAMIHPSGPANALYPLRTLAFVSAHGIQGSTQAEVSEQWRAGTLHPWQTIGEFHRPFTAAAWRLRNTRGLAVLLAAAAGGIVVLLIGRRWALAAMLTAFAAAGLSMRRNMVIPALMAAPLIAAAAHVAVTWWRQRKPQSEPKAPSIPGALLLSIAIIAAAWGLWDVASDRLYLSERRTAYFGPGVSALTLPVNTCRWLDANLPHAQPVYTDQNISSSVLYFSEKVTAVPTLTNTWATPPERMQKTFELGAGKLPLTTLDAWGLDVAVLQGWPINKTMIRSMLAASDWALVSIEGWFAVFARRTEANAAMIGAHQITRPTFDLNAFIAACRRADPLEAMSLKTGAGLLQVMGWYAEAADVWAACLADPAGARFAEAWMNRGLCLAIAGGRQWNAGHKRGLDILLQARKCFQKALDLRPNYDQAQRNLRQVERDILRARDSP